MDLILASVRKKLLGLWRWLTNFFNYREPPGGDVSGTNARPDSTWGAGL